MEPPSLLSTVQFGITSNYSSFPTLVYGGASCADDWVMAGFSIDGTDSSINSGTTLHRFLKMGPSRQCDQIWRTFATLAKF